MKRSYHFKLFGYVKLLRNISKQKNKHGWVFKRILKGGSGDLEWSKYHVIIKLTGVNGIHPIKRRQKDKDKDKDTTWISHMARWPGQGRPIQAKVICGATCPHPPPSESGRNNKIDLTLSSSSSLLSSSWPVSSHRPIVIVIFIDHSFIDDSTYLHQPTAVSGPMRVVLC